MQEIEKGVTPPKKRKYTRYPFSKMEVFDSVLFPLDPSNANTRRAALKYARDNNKIFVTKKTRDGLRVWRIFDPV